MVIKHIIELLLNPLFICLVLLGTVFFFLGRGSSSIVIPSILGLIFLLLISTSTGWLPCYITTTLESRYPVVHKVDANVHWIVVLGGGQNPAYGMPANDTLSAASIKRLVEGVRLFRLLPQAQLLLSGGGNSPDQIEALLLAKLALWFAIPVKNTVLELKSLTTAEQAKELVSLVGQAPFYLVTSAIHMPRAMALCAKQGLHPIAAPTDFTFFWNTDGLEKIIIPNAYNLSYFSIAMHELLGRAWAKLTTAP